MVTPIASSLLGHTGTRANLTPFTNFHEWKLSSGVYAQQLSDSGFMQFLYSLHNAAIINRFAVIILNSSLPIHEFASFVPRF